MKKLLLILLFCLIPLQANAAIVLIGTDGKVRASLSLTGIAVQGGSTSSSAINCILVDAILAIEETATVTNVVARNTRGNDIDLTGGKTLTITHSLYAYAETTGDTPGAGCLDGGSVDPLLNSDGSLKPGSPCIDTGTNTVLTGTDTIKSLNNILLWDGSSVVAPGGTIDMGAYEYVSGGGAMSLMLTLMLN